MKVTVMGSSLREESGSRPDDRSSRRFSYFLFRDAPYIVMIAVALGGIAYRAYAQTPILHFWYVVLPLFAALCIIAGLHRAQTGRQVWDLVWTQGLHWSAFMAAMYGLTLPEVRGVLNDNSVALIQLMLLAVGTFVAGVHARAARTCIVGVVLGLAVPAVAWIDQSGTLIVLCTAALVVVLALFWVLQRNAGRRQAG